VNRFPGKRRGGLAGRLTRYFFLLAILLLLVMVPLLVYVSFGAQRDALRRAQQATAEKVALTVPQLIEGLIRDFQRDASLLQGLEATEQQATLTTLLEGHSDVGEMAVFDSTKEKLAGASRYWVTASALGENQARAQTEQFTALQGQTYVGQVYIGVASGSDKNEPFVVVSVPLMDETGTVTGILATNVNLSYMWTAVSQSRVGEQGYVYVVDSAGHLIAHPDPYLVLQQLELDDFPELEEALAGEEGIVQKEYQGLRHQEVVGTFIPIEALGWWVIVELPTSEAYASTRTMLLLSAGLSLFSLGLAFLIGRYLSAQIVRPIQELREGADIVGEGNLDHVIRVQTGDEIGALAQAFNAMATRLRELFSSLEQRVAERTADLERRSAYLEASGEVGRAAASVLDPDQLIQQAVELIRERFGLYYVGLFLVDETREWAVLRAGTGEAGRAMLARGHRIKVGTGMIGWSVAHAEARVALEAGEDGVRLATAELPETHTEAALPLRSRGQIIGALTVQSDQPAAFDEDTIVVLQTMADQVAVALDNAGLFAEAQEALEATQRAYGELSRQAWTELLRTRAGRGYRYADRSVALAEGVWQPEMLQAAQTGQIVQADGAGAPTLAIPIKVRDHVVGALRFHKHETGEMWTTEETALLETLTEQLGIALESARLYQDTQRRAARERLTGEVTARMRETLDVERVLKTATDEVYQALGLDEIVIRLTTKDADDGATLESPTADGLGTWAPQEEVV